MNLFYKFGSIRCFDSFCTSPLMDGKKIYVGDTLLHYLIREKEEKYILQGIPLNITSSNKS